MTIEPSEPTDVARRFVEAFSDADLDAIGRMLAVLALRAGALRSAG